MEHNESGRIYFPGNPWPEGHRITNFQWTGRVERSSGIWFDLHLQTEDYRAEGEREERERGDWESPIVWNNYGSCTLSSTYWPGCAYGFQAGSVKLPLDWSGLEHREFAFDDDPEDLGVPRPFNIYLTGHDAVSAHRIKIKREPSVETYHFAWKGSIALAYAGDERFIHSFQAEVQGVPFGGILIPDDVREQDAFALVEPFVTDMRQFKIIHEGRFWKVLPSGRKRRTKTS
jgi:hypothetical protein